MSFSSHNLTDPDLSLAQFNHQINAVLSGITPENQFQQISHLTAVLDLYLQGQWTEESQPGKKPATLQAIASTLGPKGQGHIVLAQINPTPGDLAGNSAKILDYIALAEALGVDTVVFPELSLMGYPILDVIQRHPFLVAENVKWLNALAKRTGETRAIIGFVEPRAPLKADDISSSQNKKQCGRLFYNALAVLGNGKVEGITRKSLLPTYNEFYDYRTFEPSPGVGVYPPSTPELTLNEGHPDGSLSVIHGKSYALSICEDTWNDHEFFTRPLYRHRDPMADLATLKPDVFINISASPSRSRKEQLKHHLLSHIARRHHIPYLYVNQTGSVDELSFDGASRVYDASGNLTTRAASFQEQFLIANPFQQSGIIHPLPVGLEDALTEQKTFDAFLTSDLGRTYRTLVQGIRDYFEKNGFKRAVLGLSGGIDSAITTVIAADALGAENVLAVSMPSSITPADSREDARQLAINLGVGFIEIPIDSPVKAFDTILHSGEVDLHFSWGEPNANSYAKDNMQAISRATILRLLGNDYHALPLATSDKSELYMGYATVNGDMSGAFAPLADVPKTKLRMLAKWLNKNRSEKNTLPASVIEKPSGAELALDPATGKPITAEDVLMPYEFADEIIWRIEALHQSKAEMMTQTFQWEQQHSTSSEQKKIWLDKFFHRMARAVFKWWVLPPAVIVSGNGSITKTDYQHPITAGRIDWDGKTEAEIDTFLNKATLTLSQ
ncbi:MAG: NAD(+) synthase [Vampirovibrio sp.]|nr:NAD(+) synthase [Vampirovibrio sp.]